MPITPTAAASIVENEDDGDDDEDEERAEEEVEEEELYEEEVVVDNAHGLGKTVSRPIEPVVCDRRREQRHETCRQQR